MKYSCSFPLMHSPWMTCVIVEQSLTLPAPGLWVSIPCPAAATADPVSLYFPFRRVHCVDQCGKQLSFVLNV